MDSAVAGDVGGVVSNAANAIGSGYGAAKAENAPMTSQRTNPDQSVSAMLGGNEGITPLAKSVRNAPPVLDLAAMPTNTNKADTWENLGGGVANRQMAMQFANMKPRELRRAINTSPSAEQYLLQYLNAGGQLTKKQMRAIPPSTKNQLRTYGYQMPGPFGMRMY